jgi:hypothetical protein
MKIRRVIQQVSQKTKYDLPASHNREIGRVIVRWAYFEHYIQRMIWAVVFQGAENAAVLGRFAIREQRAVDRLDLLKQVSELQGFEMDEALFSSIKTSAKALSEKRDLLAHGLWTDPPGFDWAVQQTRGNWTGYRGGPKGNKRITPEAIPMSLDDLRALVTDCDAIIADSKKLLSSIRSKPERSP